MSYDIFFWFVSLWELTDWLLRSLSVATLNAFPLRSPRGANKELLYAKVEISTIFVFHTPAYANKFS